MSQQNQIEYILTVNVEESLTQLRKVEMILFRLLSVIQRLGLSPEINAAINELQRFISVVRQAQLTINLFYAASGPIGWAMLGVSVASTAISMGTILGDIQYQVERGHY